MNSTDSPTDELLEHDSLFNCDQSCILKGNSYIDCCPASKYKTPVRKACTICGVWITDTTDWMKHHFSPRHLKSICYLSSFRQKCKENQDNEGVVIPPANISTIIDSISYEQELFQMCGGSTFICAVCGSGVYDVIEHLKSLKHNESYLNVRYPDCVTKIKEECLTPTGVDWNQYEKRILTHLSENQPKADTPLTIFALKDDSEFNDWIWKCMMAFSTFTQIQNIPICIPELLSDIIPDDIQSIMTDDDNVLYNNDRCTLCRTKVFCSDSFIDHCKSELHVNKKKLFKFLKDSGKYHIVTSRSNEQSTIESLKDPFLGCETIIELTDSNDGEKAWCCAMCLVINGNVKKIGEHLCSAKHILNYLNLNYVDLEVCTSSIDKKLEELKHHASEIMKNSNPGRIQVAQLIDASVADVFDSLGEKLETVSSDRAVTNGNCIELSDDLIFIENGIKLLFSDKKEDLFWCENCNNYVLINKNKDDAKRLWNDHVTSANHLKIKEMKPKLIFDMKNFVDEKPSNIIMEELLRPGICIIGGNYMVERKIKNDDGQLINDIACLLCFELMPLEKFADHIHSRSHIKQFLHKEEPKLMRQILTEPGREDEVIENYFKQRPIRKGVRVYNPTKSEYLTNEYERLKKQIAEKERILEEKRREKAEEARLEELRRKSKDNDEKKLIEQRRTAELERIEKIKREEEERQARVLQNIRRMKERQETEQKYLLEQKRLHQRLQEERQKKKDEEKKKLEERRILDLMKKEKEALAKKEEDDKQSKKNAAVVAASRSFYQQAYNPEQLSKDQKIDNGQTQKPAYKVAKEAKWQPLNDQTFQKPSPGLQQAQKAVVKNVALGNKVADQKNTNQIPDPLMDSLKNSALLPIRPPLNAYIHPISVTCPEPLIGLELIYEFECSDDSFEPGYFCSLCTIKCLAKEIIKHVISVDHRMLYLEKAYKPLYGNIMKFYKENESSRNAAAIKQYAARVERQGGRKRIENRLSTKVPSSYLFTKKPSLFCTPSLWDSTSTATKEPSVVSKHQTSVPPPPGVVSPSHPIVPLVTNVFAPPPFIATPLVKPVAAAGFLPISGGSTLVPEPVPPPPGTTTIQEIEMKDSTDWDWDNKCAKFLKKLTSKDDFKDSGTGQKLLEKSSTKTAATPLSQKKPVELPFSVKKSTSRERDARRSRVSEKRRRSSSRRRYSRSRSRSRKRVRRSRSRSRSRRSPDRRRRHSPSPILTKNSKSKVDSNGQQNNRNREPLLITPAAATPVTKAFSVTDETLPPLKSNQKVTEPRGSKQAVDPMDYTPEATLSAEEVQVLQQLAKKDPVALERFMLQNPQVLRALLNREEQQAKQQLKEKAKMPIVEDSRQVETPRRRVPLQPDPIVAQKSTASLRNNSQILSLQDELKDKLLTSNADHSNKQSLTRQSMPNQDYGVQKSAPSAEALLMKILADEEEKKRKQAQNEKMIYDLLKQVDEITNQSKNKQVYDYSHGGGGSMSSQDKIRGMPNVAGENFDVKDSLFKQKEKPVCTPATAPTISWPPAEFDSLISDASLNVQQAKQQVLGYRGGGPSTVPENRSAAVNQSFSQQYSNFSFPSKADSTNSDLQNSLRAKYEQSRMEKNKELEMKRREAFDKLAKDLCAPNNAAAGFGLGSFAPGGLSSRSDPMEDIEQILNIARVQSQRSSGILPSPQQQQQPQQQQPRQSSNFDYSSYLGYNYQNRNG